MSYRGRDALPGASSVPAGTRLNGIYEVDRLIAQGGMGEVYEGHSVEIGDRVAIKVVLPEFAADQLIVELFRKEARVLHLLHHDAIVRYHMFATDERLGRSYLAMEYVDGQSLAVRLRSGPLSLEETIVLKNRLADGLQLAHDAGIVHRDLSLDNVILPGGMVSRAKIIDFGIAKSLTVGGERTLIGSSFAGRKTYASPEQLGMFAPAKVTGRSDIYSLALVLAAALRGEPIDMSGSPVEEIEKRRSVPDLSSVPEEMHELLSAMLQPDPADRLGTMAEVRDWEVIPVAPSPPPQKFLSGKNTQAATSSVRAPSKLPPVIKVRPPTKRPSSPPKPPPLSDDMAGSGSRMGLWIALATVATIAIGIAAGLYFGRPPEVEKPIVDNDPGGGSGSKKENNQAANNGGGAGNQSTQPQTPQVEKQPKLQPKPPRVPPQPFKSIADAANFIRDFDGGDCFFIWPIELGDKAATLAGFGASGDRFKDFVADYKIGAGFEPEVNLRQVSTAQCGVVDALRRISQVRGKSSIKPNLRLTGPQTLKQGEALSGSVMAPPTLKLELLTIDAAGGASRVTDARTSDGSFSFTAALPAGAAAESPNLLIVLASPESLDSLADLKPGEPKNAADIFPGLVQLAESSGKMTLSVGYYKVAP